jgi:glycosyltransferase involved in cell wall biosynthesis
MQILFIHQNIPGQFKHLIAHFGVNSGIQVWALGDATRVRENRTILTQGVRLYGYSFNEKASDVVSHRVLATDTNIRRGLAVAKSLETLKENGLKPDVVFGHPGWGEMLFVRDIFPEAKIVNYCEYYFNSEQQELGFDPEFPTPPSQNYQIRIQNMTQSQSLLAGNLGVSPTCWQKSRYPEILQQQIEVVFDGIDCNIVRPDASATFFLEPDGRVLSTKDEVITFVSRSLEPLRGFHVFMRTLPELQKRRPNAHVVIAGSDSVSYSPSPSTSTYRGLYCREIDGKVDWSRIHFVGRLAYERYLHLLRVSTVHVYLSYPFVLSWSLMEAMATGCSIVASNTAPVREVMHDGTHGLQVEFFDQSNLVESIAKICGDAEYRRYLSKSARDEIVSRFDLKSICLPKIIGLLCNFY